MERFPALHKRLQQSRPRGCDSEVPAAEAAPPCTERWRPRRPHRFHCTHGEIRPHPAEVSRRSRKNEAESVDSAFDEISSCTGPGTSAFCSPVRPDLSSLGVRFAHQGAASPSASTTAKAAETEGEGTGESSNTAKASTEAMQKPSEQDEEDDSDDDGVTLEM